MFDIIAQTLTAPKIRRHTSVIPPSVKPPAAGWNLDDRSEFHYNPGGVMLRSALRSRLESSKYLVAVQDEETRRIALFDTLADAATYFNMPRTALRHRMNKGYCVHSRTLWRQYTGGELVFRNMPLQVDNSRPFMLFGVHLGTKEKRLFSGINDAASQLDARYTDVRACVENNHQPDVKGWVLRIATIANIVEHEPDWFPLNFRVNVAITSDLAKAIASNNEGGFHKDCPRSPQETPKDVWQRTAAAYLESLN